MFITLLKYWPTFQWAVCLVCEEHYYFTKNMSVFNVSSARHFGIH